MGNIYTLTNDSKRNSILWDVTNQQGIEETFIHSVIHSSILSGSQSVSQSVSQLVNKSVREACAVGSDV